MTRLGEPNERAVQPRPLTEQGREILGFLLSVDGAGAGIAGRLDTLEAELEQKAEGEAGRRARGRLQPSCLEQRAD